MKVSIDGNDDSEYLLEEIRNKDKLQRFYAGLKADPKDPIKKATAIGAKKFSSRSAAISFAKEQNLCDRCSVVKLEDVL